MQSCSDTHYNIMEELSVYALLWIRGFIGVCAIIFSILCGVLVYLVNRE